MFAWFPSALAGAKQEFHRPLCERSNFKHELPQHLAEAQSVNIRFVVSGNLAFVHEPAAMGSVKLTHCLCNATQYVVT